jgi:hypothetical protein
LGEGLESQMPWFSAESTWPAASLVSTGITSTHHDDDAEHEDDSVAAELRVPLTPLPVLPPPLREDTVDAAVAAGWVLSVLPLQKASLVLGPAAPLASLPRYPRDNTRSTSSRSPCQVPECPRLSPPPPLLPAPAQLPLAPTAASRSACTGATAPGAAPSTSTSPARSSPARRKNVSHAPRALSHGTHTRQSHAHFSLSHAPLRAFSYHSRVHGRRWHAARCDSCARQHVHDSWRAQHAVASTALGGIDD